MAMYPNMYPQYPSYQQPQMDYLTQFRNQQYQPAAPANNMIWVQGENGAKAYLVSAGNTVPLWDSENQTVYIKTVDASGIPSMRILDYKERTVAPTSPANAPVAAGVEYVTRKDFDALSARVEALGVKPSRKVTVKEATEE